MSLYYLHPWTPGLPGEFAAWQPPEWAQGALDLRNHEECARVSGTPDKSAFGLFVANSPQKEALLIGDRLSGRVSKKTRNSVESALGLSSGVLRGVTVSQVLVELLTQHADPAGITRWRPLASSCVSMCGCDLHAGSIHNDPVWRNAFIAAKQHDFQAIYRGLLDGKCHADHPGMVLDYWSKKHGIEPAEFVPADIPAQDIKPHATIIGDTFDVAVDTTITGHTASGPNGGFSWTAINGSGTVRAAENNLITGGSAENNFRAEGVLSGDDHYVQAEMTFPPGTSRDGRVYTRFNASSWDGYLLLCSNVGTTLLYKVVSGAGTLINNYSDTLGAPTNRAYKLESDGSTHTPTVDGVALAAQTDTTLTGQVRGGVGGWSVNTVIDNFVFADLATPAIDSITSPVLSGSVKNSFIDSGFSGQVSSTIIQSPAGQHPIDVTASTELLNNSGFDDGINFWNTFNSVISVVGGVLRVSRNFAGSGEVSVSQIISNLIPGESYSLTADYVTDSMSGDLFLRASTSPVSVSTHPVTGSISLQFVANATTHFMAFGSLGGIQLGEFFEIDNVSVKGVNLFDIPDVSLIAANTPGTPFDSASHTHVFIANYLAESASIPVIVNPQVGWQVVEVVSAVTTPGSVFEGFATPPVDGDQVYYPTFGAVSISPSGLITHLLPPGAVMGWKLFDTATSQWQPFSFTVPGGGGVIESGSRFIAPLIKNAHGKLINNLI